MTNEELLKHVEETSERERRRIQSGIENSQLGPKQMARDM